MSTNNEKELLVSEGTVFVHCAFAVKQDPDLRKEFLKMLKVFAAFIIYSIHVYCFQLPTNDVHTHTHTVHCPQTGQERMSSRELSMFSVSLALSTVSTHRLEENVSVGDCKGCVWGEGGMKDVGRRAVLVV